MKHPEKPLQKPILAKALEKIGVLYSQSTVGQVSHIALLAFIAFIQFIRGSKKSPGGLSKQIVSQIYFTGFEAISLVALIGGILGIVVTLQATTLMPKVGFGGNLGEIMVASIVRELGPLFTAFLIAGRSGSGFATYLGNMKINHEIDALKSLGIDPIKFLVMPAMVGFVAALTVLTLVFNTVAIVFGYLGVFLINLLIGGSIQITFLQFTTSIIEATTILDLFMMILKPSIFGVFIASIASYTALNLPYDSRAVPKSVASTVVSSFVGVFILNLLLSGISIYQYYVMAEGFF
jgi:phospholipid/cholesterol/gamma-HCH transport system permease protein